jgi:hypothetical protein
LLRFTAIYLHPAAFPGVCDTQMLYLSMTTLKKYAIFPLAFVSSAAGCLGIVPCDACPHFQPTHGWLLSH